jgi:DNA-binding transcriptional regulator YhcF (GntR family)
MGYHAKEWAFKQIVGCCQDKMVLIAIAHYASDKDRTCWPSINSLAIDCCLSYRSVSRSLKSLEELGLIKRIHRFKKGAKTSNAYVLGEENQSCSISKNADQGIGPIDLWDRTNSPMG